MLRTYIKTQNLHNLEDSDLHKRLGTHAKDLGLMQKTQDSCKRLRTHAKDSGLI